MILLAALKIFCLLMERVFERLLTTKERYPRNTQESIDPRKHASVGVNNILCILSFRIFQSPVVSVYFSPRGVHAWALPFTNWSCVVLLTSTRGHAKPKMLNELQEVNA